MNYKVQLSWLFSHGRNHYRSIRAIEIQPNEEAWEALKLNFTDLNVYIE